MAADLHWPQPTTALRLRPAVLLLGPDLAALSGVSSHLRMLQASPLSGRFELLHFQVGSEGRSEGRLARLARLVAAPCALARAIRSGAVALVHINTSLNRRAFWRDLLNLAVARACGAHVLLQIHGGALPQDFVCGSALPAAVLRALLRAVLHRADAIVVLARSELAAYRAFVPAQHVVLIPNAVPCQQALRADHQRQPTGALHLVYVGRLVREKGLFELLQALQIANTGGAGHRLTLAGAGPDEPALRQHVHELGLAAQVEFAGPVGNAVRTRLLGATDVFVLPSYAEGLPYALLEAMAAGLPAIATPVGAVADLLDDGVHGRLVAPGDAAALARAIVELATSRDRLAEMGMAGRERVARSCSIERMADGFAHLYADLLATRR